MLLAVSVGNTRTALGLFAGEHLVAAGAIATRPAAGADECAVLARSWLAREDRAERPSALALASVVPALTPVWRQTADRLGLGPAVAYGDGGRLGLRVRMAMPATAIGADRLLNAIAARWRYGQPVIVLDIGTALTLDVVGADGSFVGGAIAPGPTTAQAGLVRRQPALVPVTVGGAARAIGQDRAAALGAGLDYGSAGVLDGLAERARLELAAPAAAVVATGGLAAVLAPYSRSIDHVEPWLTLEGLRLWWADEAAGARP